MPSGADPDRSDCPSGTDAPFVSVVIPCRNEVDHIAACLRSVLTSQYPEDRIEVLVIDGMSDDGTREIIRDIARSTATIRLLDNPKRITPTAMNIGVRAACGDVIVRMDAHTSYPPDYVSLLVEALQGSGADNAGGVAKTIAARDTPLSCAIATGLAHPFGVGNSHFRIGVDEPRWVDTVPFGCYRREVFDRIGLFDEALVRNQDDEFNHRLIRSGGRILLVPGVESKYLARDSLKSLWLMYHQYGYFKPLVIRKLRTVLTARQLIPAAFVAGLVCATILAPFSDVMLAALVVIVAAYAAALFLSASTARTDWLSRLCLTFVFPTIHVAYGSGFLRGIVDFLIVRRERGRKTMVGLSRTSK